MSPTSHRLVAAGGLLVIAFLALAWPVAAQRSASLPATTAAPAATFVRGVYGKDSSSTGYQDLAARGFNSVMTGPYSEMLSTVAAAGLSGVVWLGNFLNKPTCGFEKDDATITRLVQAIAGNRTITAYYLGDEPHVTECANAPALFRQRSALVHRLDPGSQTFTVIQASENGVSHDYAPWAGAVDVIGFDVYPCVRSSSICNFNAIDAAISAIKAAGIKRYWAIVQDFQDCYYRLPTPSELAAQFDRWGKSDMSGYFVFSWNYQPADRTCTGVSLNSQPDNAAQLQQENSRLFVRTTQSPLQEPGGTAPATPAALVIIAIICAALVLLGAVAMRTRPRRT